METLEWVKLHRKALQSSVFENPVYWKVWTWCLIKASHTTHKFPFNGGDIEVIAGSFITGRKQACKELKITPRQYRSATSYLKTTSRVTIKSNNKFSVITIQNWSDYQANDQQKDQPATSQRPTKDHIQEWKNGKNENKYEFFEKNVYQGDTQLQALETLKQARAKIGITL